jgi:hypothetical protein
MMVLLLQAVFVFQEDFKMAINPNQFAIDVPDPSKTFTDSYINAAKIQALQSQQQLAQQEIQRKKQLQTDLAGLGSNPTPQQIASISGKYPELSEHFKRSYDMLSSEQQQSKLSSAIPIYAAVASGNYQTAVDQLNQNAEAYKNSGQEDQAKTSTMLAQLIQLHPETANKTMGLMLASTMGADKFASTFGTLGDQNRADQKQPLENKKLAAEATTAQTTAQYADQKANQDLENQRIDNQIKRLDIQIKQANSETERGKLQLDRDKLVQEQQLKNLDKTNLAQDQIDSINQTLSTIQSIRGNSALEPYLKVGGIGLGGGVGSITGSIASFIPGTDRKDLEGLVDTLKSQSFLSKIQSFKGMGALSDAEGKKLTDAITSLNINQSVGQFKNNLGVLENYMNKAQSRLLSTGNAPTASGAVVSKTPALGVIREGDINRLMQKNPGATREQIMQYLQAVGGQK